MAKLAKDYWKRYYEEHREQRIADSIRYQQEHREAKRKYLQQYYQEHKREAAEYRRKTAERRNRLRRDKYAEDPATREAKKAEVKEYRSRKPDIRWASNLKRFGLSLEGYDRMLASQGGGCAICGGGPGDKRTTRFHVDHCHTSGRVRGLLCAGCNMGIGKFGDDAGRLERAAMYLRLCLRPAPAD